MASHIEVASNWVRQSGKAANGFRMFYCGDTIYSHGYHFPIARIVHVPGTSERVYLMTTRGYSSSTAKHKSIVWGRLCRSSFRTFHVDDVLCRSHEANVASYIARAEECEAKAKRARVHGPSLLEQAHAYRNEAATYAALFGVA